MPSFKGNGQKLQPVQTQEQHHSKALARPFLLCMLQFLHEYT